MTRLTALAALTFSFVICAAVRPAAAQSLGAKGGLNFATQGVTPKDGLGEVAAKAGVVGGAFVTFKESSRLSFEVDALISMRRVGFGPAVLDTITYVETPVLAKFPVMKRPDLVVRAIGGAVPAFRLTAKEAVSGVSGDATDAYKPIDVAVAAGAEITWKKWVVDVRYLFGLTELYEVPAPNTKARHRALQALVGYRLR